MNQFKDVMKTSNTFLKFYTGFYILWQSISLLLLIGIIVGIFILFGQLQNMII